LFPPGTPKITLAWKIELSEWDDSFIDLLLEPESPLPLTLTQVPTSLYFQCAVRMCKDKRFTRYHIFWQIDKIRSCAKGSYLGKYGLFDESQPLQKFLDEEGSLNLKVEADFYVYNDGLAEILPLQGQDNNNEVESFKARKEIILAQVASLLGDEVTSDVIISIHDKERDVEVGKFFCHKAILSGNRTLIGKIGKC